MARTLTNCYWFLYYRHVDLISMDEITNGLVWKRVPEITEGFPSRDIALDWLEFMAGDRVEEVEPSYWAKRYQEGALYRLPRFPGYLYTIRPMGIMYMGPGVDVGSAWFVGALREVFGTPMPEAMGVTARSKFRLNTGDYTVTFNE